MDVYDMVYDAGLPVLIFGALFLTGIIVGETRFWITAGYWRR